MSQREQVSQLNKTETDVEPHIVTVGKTATPNTTGHSGLI